MGAENIVLLYVYMVCVNSMDQIIFFARNTNMLFTFLSPVSLIPSLQVSLLRQSITSKFPPILPSTQFTTESAGSCNTAYYSETHLQLKSHEVVCHNIHFSFVQMLNAQSMVISLPCSMYDLEMIGNCQRS